MIFNLQAKIEIRIWDERRSSSSICPEQPGFDQETSSFVLASSYYLVFVFETFHGNQVKTNIGFSEVQHSLAPAPTQENISFKVQLSEISLALIFPLTPANILLECFEL